LLFIPLKILLEYLTNTLFRRLTFEYFICYCATAILVLKEAFYTFSEAV